MGEEVKITDYDDDVDVGIEAPSDGFEERVREWEDGLPNFDELTPLSYALISPELASAFRISPEQSRTMFDVNRASRTTFSSLRGGQSIGVTSSNNYNFKLLDNDDRTGDQMVTENDDTDLGSDSRKIRRVDDSAGAEEADSALRNDNCADDPSAKNLKRPRLVWTPQLHKRFVDVVAHLGIKNAVPKTIMQLMNVEGLTRENVASHLQKYRLYLKRMQGLSNEGPSSSDHLFASTPVPQSLHESGGNGHGNNSNGHMAMPIPMPYAPQMVPMPMMGMSGHPHGHGVHVGMPVGSGGGQSAAGYHHQYNMVQQRDWSGNKFASYHQVAPNDN